MIRIWRLCKAKWAASAFTGRGAADNPGRWNSFGRRAIYCAETRALAALEILVHVENKRRLRRASFVVIPVDVPKSLVLTPERLPANWSALPAPASTRALGDRMLSGALPVIRVPSAVVAGEFCYVLNPEHPRFPELKIGEPIAFSFDDRVIT